MKKNTMGLLISVTVLMPCWQTITASRKQKKMLPNPKLALIFPRLPQINSLLSSLPTVILLLLSQKQTPAGPVYWMKPFHFPMILRMNW